MRITYTHHLVSLLAQIEAAAARLSGADHDLVAGLARRGRREACRLSARLDASPLTDATADTVDEQESRGELLRPPAAAAGAVPEDRAGGWAQVLRLDRLDALPTQELAAVEYANVLRAFDAEAALAPMFFADPLLVLSRLHAELTAGLLDPALAGRPRWTSRAIHDGAQGRIIYRAPDAEALPGLLQGLADWLGTGSAEVPTVLVAGAIQERLLEWQPYEAANGRLARSASRVVLRARGLDAQGLIVHERGLGADPGAYYHEVAATMRRRGDLGLWLERYAEAVEAATSAAADEVAPLPRPVPPRRSIEALSDYGPGAAITLKDYTAAAGVNAEAAREDLRILVRSGELRVEPRSRGLRFRRS